MDELGKLKIKRGQIKGQLTRTITYLNSVDTSSLSNVILSQISCRLDKVEPLLSQFEAVNCEIEAILIERSLPLEEMIFEEFEEDYFEVVSKMKTILFEFNRNQSDEYEALSQPGSAGSSGRRHVQQVHQQIKLPEVKLPKFNGNFDRWLEFRDSFLGLVKNNTALGNVEKFYYLKSFLEGDALQVLSSIEISNDNFEIAWSLLMDRYENKRLIVYNYVKSLFDTPAVTKESYSDLRKVYDLFNKNLRSLKNLGEKTETWDTLVIYLLTSKFDNTTRREWEYHKIKGELPTMADINEFLKNKCELLEKLEIAKKENKLSESKTLKVNKYKGNERINAFSVVTNKNFKCYYCKQKHSIYKCDLFKNLEPKRRSEHIKQQKLCINCFNPSHSVQDCNVRANCRLCEKRHNTLLHVSNESDSSLGNRVQDCNQQSSSNAGSVRGVPVTTTAISQTASQMTQSLLSTASVYIYDGQHHPYSVRVILDPGSQSNFITKSLVDKLGLKTHQANYAIVGVGDSSSLFAHHAVNVEIQSKCEDYSANLTCLVIPKITQNLPIVSFDSSKWNIPHNIILADDSFNVSGEIDMLIGVSLFYDLLLMEQICQQGIPVLQKTKLGWIVSGDISVAMHCNQVVACLSVEHIINENLLKFWEIEEVDSATGDCSPQLTHFCERHFKETFRRSSEGRFIVRFPFKDTVNNLGDSKEMAKSRFLALERRLEKNHFLRREYTDFMSEYLSLGHMTMVSSLDDTEISYFLPHHAVVKEASLTTKVRVVFDASAKTDSGYSLNDIQHAGPTIQSDLVSIILRFRIYPYVLNADISKMYRQVLIDPKERRFQRIFWRSTPSDELECFELNTVTYGTTSAPFLAVRCLHQLAYEFQEVYPLACETILKDMYVDDLLTGSFSQSELLKIQREISLILSNGGFDLRKWLSNKRELLNQFQVNDNLEANLLILGENEQSKTLGIVWNSSLDTIQYSIRNFDEQNCKVTKRLILSVTSQIYDPLGLLGPIVVNAKILLQLLWQEKLSWDEEVSDHIRIKWLQFCDSLYLLNNLKIPRHVLVENYRTVEIHGFADASEKAYGGCVYLRCLSESHTYTSRLLVAKSRVAPLKKTTLPRLELCAAVLLVKLVNKVQQSLPVTISGVFFWSDSEIVLCWIKGSSSKWKTFVANRIAVIESLSSTDQWFHVRSEDNPADCLSRGVSTAKLIKSKLWWKGPHWLIHESLPINSSSRENPDHIPEQKILVNTALTDFQDGFDISFYSTLSKLQRIVAYCLRFCNNMKGAKKAGCLTAIELDESLKRLIRMSQMQAFTKEYNALLTNRPIGRTSNILSLNPFMDEHGCIRVGGRINRADIPYNQKHPILLHNKHHLTVLIILNEHERLLHCGPQQLLYALRIRYWPISGRSLVKKIVRSCITCFKAEPQTGKYLMGNLPECRVTAFAPVFSHCGLDYAGPIFLKDRKGRKPNLLKGYICLFICMSTKCVHLELVSDLTTAVFISALRRFIARRGKPLHMYSDNGTTFVGANADLSKFLQSEGDKISSALSVDGINWHFIPPRAPNFGGLWEAGVKRVKYYLKRIVGGNNLTYEEFNTVLTQIEGIVNSRPLCPMSSDPNDTIPLTPAHFLIGKSLVAPPEPDYTNEVEVRLTRYQYFQSLVQQFWRRWTKEYLSEMQSRLKWKTNFANHLEIGSLVVIKEDNLPPFKWKTARIIELHKGTDDITRVVTVRTSDGSILKRAVSKLCALPVEQNIF